MHKAVTLYIEKTKEAEEIERKYGLNLSLYQHNIKDAGFDARAAINNTVILKPNQIVLIPIGLKLQLSDSHFEIQVRPRSGLASKFGITIVNSPGTVDFNYRDEIKVILQNAGHNDFLIQPGDRIAQLCVRELPEVSLVNVDTVSREGDRGGGFGHSGVA